MFEKSCCLIELSFDFSRKTVPSLMRIGMANDGCEQGGVVFLHKGSNDSNPNVPSTVIIWLIENASSTEREDTTKTRIMAAKQDTCFGKKSLPLL